MSTEGQSPNVAFYYVCESNATLISVDNVQFQERVANRFIQSASSAM